MWEKTWEQDMEHMLQTQFGQNGPGVKAQVRSKSRINTQNACIISETHY